MKFVEQQESRPEVQSKLSALLIAPIQRIPRYRLLLKQILDYTSPVDNDFLDLKSKRKTALYNTCNCFSVFFKVRCE